MYRTLEDIRRELAAELALFEAAIDGASAQWKDSVARRVRQELLQPMASVVANWERAVGDAADAVSALDRVQRD